MVVVFCLQSEDGIGDAQESRVFFFFQAEDGIRDLVRSRGLGDVYARRLVVVVVVVAEAVLITAQGCVPVPNTHLTLPTNREV